MAAPTEMVLDRVHSSNMQPSEKNAITRALTTLVEPSRGIVSMARPSSLVEFAAESGVAALTGATLGVMQAELKDGLDRNGKPLDGAIAAVTFVAGAFGSKTAQEISKTSIGILAFRKTEQFLSVAKAFSKKADPVETAGEGL